MEANIYTRSFALVKICADYITKHPQLLLAHPLSFTATTSVIWFVDPRPFLTTGPFLAQVLKTLTGLLIAGNFALWLGNVILIVCARCILDGDRPSLITGLWIAFLRIPTLVCRTIVTYLFALPIAFITGIAHRFSSVSNLLFGIGSPFRSSWLLATHFVVPVIALENVGPITSVQLSSNLAERTWVQEVLKDVSLGFMFILLAAPNLLLSGIPSAWRYLPASCLLLTLMAYGVASSIYQTALYYFAKSGEVPRGFEPVFAPEVLPMPKNT